MKIEKNRFVSLSYELRENDSEGKIIEVVEEGRPLNFIYGTGKLLQSFESNLGALSKGDSFSFSLSSPEAYGDRREEMIVDVPISVFMVDGKVDENICYVGNVVPMMDGSGNPLSGMICEVTDMHARMDFNHPMAGVNLCFSGKVIEVREATSDELNNSMHSHSCSSCGGHEGSGCGGSC